MKSIEDVTIMVLVSPLTCVNVKQVGQAMIVGIPSVHRPVSIMVLVRIQIHVLASVDGRGMIAPSPFVLKIV
jgi:hypothetical protein